MTPAERLAAARRGLTAAVERHVPHARRHGAPPALPIDPDQAALVVTAYRMAYPLTFQPAAAAGLRADPVTALLVQSGRLSQWAAVALGRLTFAGPHPELGPRFAELFVFP